MKLYLNNFRCFRGNHSFTFNEHGITLITGTSGIGKSTIIMAIYFALTDKNPCSKLISDGCTSCTVKLEFPTWNLVRTRGPRRLLVMTEEKRMLEDEPAQNYISSRFGSHFADISYIPQQYTDSFLFKKPQEKLELLESLCFKKNPSLLKEKCSVQIKTLQAEYQSLKGQLQTLKKIILDISNTTPPDLVEPPCASEPLEKELKELRSREKSCMRGHDLQIKKKQCIQLIENVEKELQTFPLIKYDDWKISKHILALKELESVKLEESKLWDKYSRDDCCKWIEDYSHDIALHEEYKTLQTSIASIEKFSKKLEQYQKEKELISSAKESDTVFQCPVCTTSLSVKNQQLVLLNDDTTNKSILSSEVKQKRIAELNMKIAKVQCEISNKPGIVDMRSRLEEIETLIDVSEDLEGLQNDLMFIREYYTQNNSTQEKHEVFRKTHAVNILESLTLADAQKLLEQIQHRKQLEKQRSDFQKHLKNYEDQIRDNGSKEDIEQVRLQIEICSKQIQRNQEQKHAHDLFLVQEKEFQKYTNYSSQIQCISEQLDMLQKKISAYSDLKQEILRAEADYIESKMDELTTLVNAYCQQIFSEPLSVNLSMSKPGNTEKVQVQLNLYYKNMNCDVALLSGGEQARLNIAFIIALANLFHSPLLLLDECTSHLDHDMAEQVLESITNAGVSKVILIAHQVVEGNFEQIIHVKGN